ncbi:MAG: Terminase small subunit [Chthoniobacteraceae bacterium]|nr:Terminase small subunit [Chthoniobacteraceae bacterium]
MTGPRQKFCEGIVTGLTATEAYLAAYPKASRRGAEVCGSRLLRNVEVSAEIARMRAVAEKMAGSAVLTLMEKRIFLARVVRAVISQLAADSDLWQSIKRTKDGIEFRLPDKLRAIELDNNLAGTGSEADANDALAGLLQRCMK